MAASISADDQLDDHCRITFMGQDWWIVGKCDDLICLRNENGATVLDVSAVRWPEYIAAAQAMIAQRVAS